MDKSDPSERRSEPRRSILLRARIVQGDGLQCHCTVRDYCSGGLLVQRLASDKPERLTTFKVAQTIEMRTELLTDTGSRPIQIKAAIAWLRDTHLGLKFNTPSAMLFGALKKHDQLARSGTAGTPTVHAGSEARRLAKLRHVAQRELPPILRELLVTTGQGLLQATDKAFSNSEQQQMFEDMHALEELRQSDILIQAILSAALDPVAVEPADSQMESEGKGLSLIDNKEFECWLEASRVATILDGQFSAQLNAIGSRLADLRTIQTPNGLSVPFEPQHFTSALKNLAGELNLGTTSCAVLFNSAATVLAKSLGDFYAQLNATLDAMGAGPATLNTVAGKPHPKRRQPDTTDDSSSADAPEPVAVSSHPSNSGDAVVSATQGETPLLVDPKLLRAVHAYETQQRESQAKELMAFVSNISNMTESLQTWLDKIGEPMMRKVAADGQFFHNPKDPLREIVDGLGHLQMFRANPDADPANDPIREQVTELLQPISKGDADEETLRSIAQALNRLNNHQSDQYQRNVERVAKSSEGRDRIRRTRLAVATELNRRYAGRQVPGLLPELIEVGWRALLELSWLKSENGDAGYNERLALLDEVVARLGGEAFASDSHDTDAQALFPRVQLELADAAFDPFRRHALETKLRQELSGPRRNSIPLIEMPALETEDKENLKVRPEDISEAAWQRLLARCELLAVGDRVSLLDRKKGRRDLRIAWIRSDGGVFTLVDHRGLRVSDIRLSKLAHGLHCRRIELDPADGRPLSERAIDAILERMEQRLSHEAAHDSLTGLINRQQFQAALEQAVTMPGQDTGVLLWIDLDQFRLVNEIHGYDTGDRLLIAVARLLEQVDGTKVLAHVGADRFGLFLPDIGLDDGERRAQAICKSVRDMPFDWTGQPFVLAVSIGVVGTAVVEKGFGSMLQAADDALDAAKSAGGNCTFLYHEDDPNVARRKDSVQWLAKVDEALERGQLRLRCQPIIPVRPNSGLSPHYEVLLGVNNGSTEPLPISHFIEAAERYNRMRAVDRWVVRTTMEWIAANRPQMSILHGFAVNLSGQTADDPSFVEFVRQQFQRTGVDPSWVSFEVTETVAVADLSCAAGIIRELKMIGCQVALDDFGSGQASYSYLKELPVDWLKIDGVFVRKIAQDAEDYAVVKSINEIGHFMGKKTIAEYVANDAILHSVREIGVDFAQGFGISPPMLMDDLLQSVASTGAPLLYQEQRP